MAQTTLIPPITQPTLGPMGWARWAWRQLTSMRTALFLLLLLSIAAVPGSIFPQRAVDAGQVADFVAANPTASIWLDRFSLFDVYTSPWFSAIYLLLVVSLLGCIVPRSRLHWRTVRALPPRAPAHLERLAEHSEFTIEATPDEALARARRVLRGRRYRVHAHAEGTLSAEGGYLRESGNLVFHTAICVVIIGVAAGYLWGWRGDVIVPVGDKFSSTSSTYDTFSYGPLVDPASVPPFTLKLLDMTVVFEDTPGRQLGVPRKFEATAQVREAPGAELTTSTIGPNEPLTVAGADVFLLGNGYAPVITVRDAAGAVLYREATPFLAQDNSYRSVGAVKVPAASPKQLGFSGIFLPTAEPTYRDGPVSLFPDLRNPELVMTVWEGTLAPGGRPQSVYTLNTSEMTQITGAGGAPVVLRMTPGQTVSLPGERGSVTLESVPRFAGLSVRVDPGKGLTLVAAVLAMMGLVASLLIKRRRVFVRVRPDHDAPPDLAPRTVVTIGALAKSADPTLGAHVRDLSEQMTARAPRQKRTTS